MDDLTTTTGIAALAAGGLALIALIFAIVLAVKLRRIRANQLAVLGGADKRDLVSHAARLETGFTDLREWVEESLTSSEMKMGDHSRRIDGCLAYAALVRYDAYNELSGAQSSSVALLDTHRNGIVLTSIVSLSVSLTRALRKSPAPFCLGSLSSGVRMSRNIRSQPRLSATLVSK